MAVSKALRYQVLRRDGHTCRYCGRKAPDVPLRVDHVVPAALGGSDDPANLAAACHDCNSGKAATPPDAPLVADVDAAALRWARALALAAEQRAAEREHVESVVRHLDHVWSEWNCESGEVPRPADWEQTVRNLYAAGLDPEFLEHAAGVAMKASNVYLSNVFRYFAGVCWREVKERQETARQLIESGVA